MSPKPVVRPLNTSIGSGGLIGGMAPGKSPGGGVIGRITTDPALPTVALRAELDAEFGSLSPEVQADVQANLDVIHEAIVQINAELEKDPNNALLQHKLLAAYRQELNLLRRVSGLSRNVMTRSDI